MPRRHFNRGSAVARGRKRKLVWVRGAVADVATASSGHIDLFSAFRTTAGITINLPGITIAGIRIRITIRVDDSATVDAAAGILFGASVQTLGITPTTTPVTQKELDYMLYQWCPLAMSSSIVTQGVPSSGSLYSFDISTKSKRRMEEVGQTLWLDWGTTGSISIEAISAEWSIPILLP